MMLSALPVSKSRSRRRMPTRMLARTMTASRQSLEDQIYKQFLKDITTPANLWEFDIQVTLSSGDSWTSGGGLFSVLIECFRPGEKIRPEASSVTPPPEASRIAWAGDFEQFIKPENNILFQDPVLYTVTHTKSPDTLKEIIELIATRALFRVISKNLSKSIQEFEQKEPTYEEVSKATGLDAFKKKIQNPDLLKSTDIQKTIALLKSLQSQHPEARTILNTMKTLKNPYYTFYAVKMLEKICNYISNVQYYERRSITQYLNILKPEYKTEFTEYYSKLPTSYIILEKFGTDKVLRIKPSVIMTLTEESVQNRLAKPFYNYEIFNHDSGSLNLGQIAAEIYYFQEDKDSWLTGNLKTILEDMLSLDSIEYELDKINIRLFNSLEPRYRELFNMSAITRVREGVFDILMEGSDLKMEVWSFIHEVNRTVEEDVKKALDKIKRELRVLKSKLRV